MPSVDALYHRAWPRTRLESWEKENIYDVRTGVVVLLCLVRCTDSVVCVSCPAFLHRLGGGPEQCALGVVREQQFLTALSAGFLDTSRNYGQRPYSYLISARSQTKPSHDRRPDQ
ncbi:hypothetical protein MRX96_008700 [Rhipicephalus microplus]